MTTILAIDPGGTSCGYAAVGATTNAKLPAGRRVVHFLDAGTFEAELGSFDRLLARLASWDVSDLHVAIERPRGFVFQPFRGPTLLDTAATAGGIAWVCRSRGVPVVEMAAEEVRKTLLGKTRLRGREQRGDRDALLKTILPGVVTGLPARTNVHVRDSLALAVVASWRLAMASRRA